jgi:hypothetical protein
LGDEIQIAPGVPDLSAANRLPIADVADALGIERHGSMLRCWRPENHQHADRTPSVGIWRRRNKARCFLCDPKPLSPVDLVMSLLNVDAYAALLWLDARFGLPRIPKGKHLARRQRVHGRVGVNGRLEAVVRSGLFAGMSHAEIRLLAVLDAFADPQTDTVTISYRGLGRYAGLAKDSSVSKGLKRLANLHAVEVVQQGCGGRGPAQCSSYRLTLEHSDFLRHLRACHAATREQVDAQRRIRAERRARLKAAWSNLPLPPDGSGNFRTTAPERRQIYTGNTLAPALAVEEGKTR